MPTATPRAVAVWCARALLWVRLADGREVGAPLAWISAPFHPVVDPSRREEKFGG